MFSGTIDAVATNAAPANQIAALVSGATKAQEDATLGGLSLALRQVVLFPIGFKESAPDKDRPDYWGGANFGDGTPVARSSVWLKTDRNGRAFMSGATSYPLPGKSEAEMQQSDLGLQDLVQRSQVTRGMPDKKRGKGRDE